MVLNDELQNEGQCKTVVARRGSVMYWGGVPE
jgi:hypothetical protein